jgi:hypothetical protein
MAGVVRGVHRGIELASSDTTTTLCALPAGSDGFELSAADSLALKGEVNSS